MVIGLGVNDMAIRWRADGRLVCAAMTEPEDGDTYIDDRLAYQLTVTDKVIYASPKHKTNGLWYWASDYLSKGPSWK